MADQSDARSAALFFLCLVALVTAKQASSSSSSSSSKTEQTSASIVPSSAGLPNVSSTRVFAFSPTSHADGAITMTTASLNITQLQQVRRNIIRGSNSAVTITKRRYLKKEMCTSASLQQAVRHRGCLRRLIVNRFCYGQCNSFFIPKTVPRDDSSEASLENTAFKSCSFCRPKATRWVRVLLQCPKNEGMPTVRKKVQLVMQCSCTALTIN